jgi:hypothetical protein
MRRFARHCISALLLVGVIGARQAEAVPLLQLDIVGGSYDETTQTIISDGPVFQLVALLTPGGTKGDGTVVDSTSLEQLLRDTYYISAAIVPQLAQTTPSPNIGSFEFDGDTLAATSGMYFGTPPYDLYEAHSDAELPGHGVFPTYYSEFDFQFDEAQRTTTYNTQDNSGTSPLNNPAGGSYYALFSVDTTLLQTPYQLHFDLYNEYVRRAAECKTRKGVVTCTPEDLDAAKFAPFSHDAEGGPGVPPPPPPIPEPATLLMVAGGLAVSARKLRQAARIRRA